MFEPFSSLLEPYPEEKEAFGSNWCGPKKYISHNKVLVAKYPKIKDGDGQDVEVYCTAAPARFYTLVVLPGKNSIGEPLKGYQVGTGSSGWDISAKIAQDISDGMLVFEQGD